MMRIAIPTWQGRVSPVFDVAGNLLLVDCGNGRESSRQSVALNTEHPQWRVNLLLQHEVKVLLCGAISRPLEMALTAAGIEMISHICGDVEQILAAFLSEQWNPNLFLMPGCCGRRRRYHAGRSSSGRCQPDEQKGGGDHARW